MQLNPSQPPAFSEVTRPQQPPVGPGSPTTRLSREQLAGRATRTSRSRFLVTAAAVTVAVGVLAAELQRPLWGTQPLFAAANTLVASAFGLLGVLLNGLRPGVGARPAAWVVGGLLWSGGAPVLADLTSTLPIVVVDVVLALLATAIVATTLRVRLYQLDVVEQVAKLPRPITGTAVQTTLRRSLGDPRLEVHYWLPGGGTYVDADGHTVTGRDDRLVVDVVGPARDPVAVVYVDVQHVRFRDQVAATMTLIGPALEAARLNAVASAHGVQSRALEAGWAERRELEQLLHDGAQTRLSALTMRLGAARSRTDAQAGQVLADAQAQLGLALRELRELAHGIHSTTLTESGLGVAVESAAGRYGIPVRVVVPPGRFAPTAEALAYYVVCWMLTAYIHRADGVVDVIATTDGVRLRLRITGRTDPCARRLTADEALESSIALRVRAAGGALSITELPTADFVVDVDLPC
ncbi:sensor histidine kinase [Cryptosporangium minutisporangium]|uniref:Signal transduction histidine kinase subgroup 3 dimerisation and phosphoacceptor domain-containing protein n=1 Tax=Cryptosporangium minutisporangium TaxID=113569 RepID=A0ABP6T7E5_9ACTN